MIIKARSISTSRMKNLLTYIVKNEKNHTFLAADGVATDSITLIKNDFLLYQKSNLKNGYVSVVISPNAGDSLTHSDLSDLLQSVLQELKLENRQYYAVLHKNTKTPHIHLVCNRLDFDSKVWNDHHVAWKCQQACEKICQDQKYTSAMQRKGKYIPTANTHNNYMDSRNQTAKQIREIFRNAFKSAKSIQEVHNLMKEQGVGIEIEKFKNGLYGMRLKKNGETFKASKIDRLLSLVPTEEGYGANSRLQLILDRNFRASLRLRTIENINSDLIKFPERVEELAKEYIQMLKAGSASKMQKSEAEEENDREAFLRRKRRRGLRNI